MDQDSLILDGQQSETFDPWFSFDQEVREYILNTLGGFVSTGDALSNSLFGVLRRVLAKASHDDLQNVILETSSFIDGLRAKGLVLESEQYLAEIQRQGSPDWDEQRGEVNPSQVPSTELQQRYGEAEADTGYEHPSERDQGQEGNPQGSSGGYETTLAGDTDSDREVNTESLPEDGTGGPVASHDPNETV